MYFRKVVVSDMDLIRNWSNDSVVRQFSHRTGRITEEEHRQWFQEVMNDPQVIFLIAENDGIPAGQMRINLEPGKYGKISISVSSEMRGMGVGVWMLEEVQNYLKAGNYPLDALYGEVKKENHASVRAFQKAGYIQEDQEIMWVFHKEIGK